jgi:outer membrane protein TolC
MWLIHSVTQITLTALVVAVIPASAQDLHRLEDLRAAAARQDPRSVQPDLLRQASELRLDALRAQRRPRLDLTGQGTVQTDVPQIPIELPGQTAPSPPKEQFRLQVEANWTVWDGGLLDRRQDALRARLAEDVAGVAVTLDRLRQATTEAFFGALLEGSRADTLGLAARDLEARLELVQARADAGAALAADAAAIEAELLRVRQEVRQAAAARGAALDVLERLTGSGLGPDARLALPELDPEITRVLALLDQAETGDGFVDPDRDPDPEAPLLGRPELVRLERTARRAEAEALAREAERRPSVSLFGQAGTGRPNPYDFFTEDVSEFALAGVRFRWSLFDGRRAAREAEALRVEARLAATDAAALLAASLREVADERADLDRLEEALATDQRIVELREEILRVAGRQLDEGVLTPDDYTDRLTDLTAARLALERHRIERAWTGVRLLTTLGQLPEPPLEALATRDDDLERDQP